MSFWRKIFGISPAADSAPKAESVVHEGYTIQPTPREEGGSFRICADISREIDGELKTHQLVRADMFPNREEAIAACFRKAKQVILEQGDKMFG